MSTPDRPVLDLARLRSSLQAPWTKLEIVERTGSTNADLLRDAATTPSGTVLLAEQQVAGRGRLDRSWTSPARAGLTFSALLRLTSPPKTWGWLPLLTGLAVHEAVAGQVEAVLKWPNDLLVGPDRLKAAGILVQVSDDAAVVGIGLNVTTTEAELPLPTATSLARAGWQQADRGVVLAAVLDALGRRYLQWADASGDAEASGIAEDYRARCATIGQDVTVSGADGSILTGSAVGVDSGGALVVNSGGVRTSMAAGDVVHLRPSVAAPEPLA